jgi:hypothetical protein
LGTPKPDPKKIYRKGKSLEGASSSKSLGIFGDLPDSVFHTSIVVSEVPHLPVAETHLKS